ncbi:Hypothetical_protein [Hexamita inflata]|uniref:Hypothetical_protein n=1 Tax=Hexamita inflata TaxID=28002 RepID=A0AA86PK53_9EUKA|nr:Hypothetical protein HINF_LOCUS26303 [Hexamita inflata]
MNTCILRQNKLFGKYQTTAFYQIENNCIILHYFKGKKKVEYFNHLSELVIQQGDEKEILQDIKNGITIEIRNEIDSTSKFNEKKTEQNDIYIDFESSGYKVYEETIFEPNSFTPKGDTRYIID